MDPYKRTTIVYALFSMAVVFTDPVFALYLNAQGFEPIWLALILSSFSLASIYVTPLIGGISDNWGRRPLILGGIMLHMLAFVSYLLFHHPLIIFFTRIMEALGYFAVALVAVAKLEDILSERKEKKKNAQIGMSLSISKIGHVLGPLIGGLMATYYGITSPFYAAVLVLGGLGVAFFFAKHRVHPKPPLEKLTFNPVPPIRDFLKIKSFRGLSVLVMVHQFSLPALFVFLPIHVVQNMGMGIEYVGLALFVKELPQVLQFLAGRLTDQWGSKRVLVVGNSLCGIALLGLSVLETFDYFLVALFIYGVGTSMLGIGSLSLLSGIAEKRRREATYLGAQVSVSKIGAFAGFLSAGLIVQISSIPTLFTMCGALILLGIGVAEEWLSSHTFPNLSPRRLAGMIFNHR